MSALTSFPGLILDFFKTLLSGSSPEGDAANRREMLVRSAALLEKAKAAPAAPPVLKEALAGLTRLVYLTIQRAPEAFPGGKDLVPAIRSLAERAAEQTSNSRNGNRLPLLADEARGLALRLMSLLEHVPELQEQLRAEDGPGSIRERMALAEVRDMAEGLDTRKTTLPETMHGRIDRIRDIAVEMATYCEKHDRAILRHCKFLKKYLSAAHTVANRSAALRETGTPSRADDAVTARSLEILDRIADAFASEKQALIDRNREDFSIDLAVLDTLLDLDGK